MVDPRAAARGLRRRAEGREPRLAIVLGSGLGGLVDRLDDALEIPYSELPGWPLPGVAGHSGRAVLGSLGGATVLGLSGRVHVYEGQPPWRVVFYVRVLAALGVRILFLSNAAGAIRRGFAPGDLMLIRDHINLMWRSPLRGPVREGESRFPDLSSAYDPELSRVVCEVALERGIRLVEGVYAAVSGPSYETPAEIRMLERLGADAVGMSTVPEVIAARAAGLRCVAVSCLTNYAAGVGDGPLDHSEVLATTRRAESRFQSLVAGWVERLGLSEQWKRP
ncbi:MAG: purine-nucleoside phosphorylase [Gemmatimonadota bacterium]